MPAHLDHTSASPSELMTKVAIVEDNPTLRQYLTDFIGGTPGHKCVCACASAEEAVLKIPAARPNVVLMDINLPGSLVSPALRSYGRKCPIFR